MQGSLKELLDSQSSFEGFRRYILGLFKKYLIEYLHNIVQDFLKQFHEKNWTKFIKECVGMAGIIAKCRVKF